MARPDDDVLFRSLLGRIESAVNDATALERLEREANRTFWSDPERRQELLDRARQYRVDIERAAGDKHT